MPGDKLLKPMIKPVQRVLITGMSGTGKSSVIEALAARGLKAIDTDWNPEWERLNGDEWVWREDQIRMLLDQEDADVVFISACVSNQSKFYDRFDHVILLTAPELWTPVDVVNRSGRGGRWSEAVSQPTVCKFGGN